MLQGHPCAGAQGAQVLGRDWDRDKASQWASRGDSKRLFSMHRALLNWRTKLRRFLTKKLKEQAKELDIK